MASAEEIASLVAWLRREAAMSERLAEGSAEPYGQRIVLNAAANLRRAADLLESSAGDLKAKAGGSAFAAAVTTSTANAAPAGLEKDQQNVTELRIPPRVPNAFAPTAESLLQSGQISVAELVLLPTGVS